ncbi:hypothetical protein D104_02365 [Marinomonas profundimaris]|uniref:Uncharacterized protein n=1 Tax=Marinomonas profundimaris TaxID=1208321 RepID=W1RYV9_9GAMM|nr:hypothetical protein D104_02365 [Marinomonas profundimaris]
MKTTFLANPKNEGIKKADFNKLKSALDLFSG